MVAYSSSQKGGSEAIYVKQTSDGRELQVTRDQWPNTSPLWSPDDQRIAFLSIRDGRPGIYTSPFLGGAVTPIVVTDGANISLRYWSRDGGSIYYDQAGNLYRLSLQKGESVKVTDLPDVQGVSGRFFAVSPDEKRIVFVDTRDGQTDLWMISAGGNELVRVTNDEDPERRPVWHPDGKRLLYNITRNERIQINIVEVDSPSEPIQVTRGDDRYSLMGISPEGDKIFYSMVETRADISSIELDTGKEVEVAAESEAELWVDTSPDGRSIVYLTNNSPNPSGTIRDSTVIIREDDLPARQLPQKGFDARWLPDGRHISVFRKSASAPNDLDVSIVDSVTGTETNLTNERVRGPEYSAMPISRIDVDVLDFSADGKRVVFVDLKNAENVKLIDRESGLTKSVTSNENPSVEYRSPTFSRDGRLIAMTSRERFNDRRQKSVYRVLLFDGTDLRELYSTSDGLRFIGWSANDDIVVASSSASLVAPTNVDLLAVSTSGQARKLSTLAAAYGRTATMSHDGLKIAFTVNRDEHDDIWMIALTAGSKPQQVSTNSTSRQFLTNLAFSADDKRIFFDKQEEVNSISMFENFE
jgi:Tol biopolymer transport system component